ncbi:MAG: carboxypeptidase-like regulatory domain-containing protein [bacterium]|nr:carboxypeptidase-like regulatory domain-containing protein [bacterium]
MNRFPIGVVLLLMAVALMGGIGWWLLRGGDELAPLPVTGDVVAESAVRDAKPAAGAAPATVEVESVPHDFLRDEASVDKGEAVRSGRPLVVQVWLGKKGVPAPAAEVFVFAGTDDTEDLVGDWKGNPFAPHLSELAEERGTRYEADSRGVVELPPVQEWVLLSARLPGQHGFRYFGREHGELEGVTLRPDETVTVRVVDLQGRTVSGVPVGIVQTVPVRERREELVARMRELEGGLRKVQEWVRKNPNAREQAGEKMNGMQRELRRVRRELEAGGRGGDRGRAEQRRKAAAAKQRRQFENRPELRARRHTDDQGLAVFRHFQLYRNKGGKWWPESAFDRFQAALLVPLAAPRSREFSGRPAPEEVIELQLPATGSLALRTVDRDGRPFTHPVRAQLRVVVENAVPWSRVDVRKKQDDDAILFPFVGLGLAMRANCRLDDEDFRWRSPRIAGPQAAGERVEFDLVVAPGDGMLHGRLLDASGRALGGEEITFLISDVAGRLEGEEVILDRSGRFHLPYKVNSRHRPPFDLQIRQPDAAPLAGLSLAFETLPRQHVTDLGELRLDGFGIVAEGVVVDDRGEPIPGAWLQLEREREVGQEEQKLAFREEAFVSATADEDGRFALFGELQRGRYRLHVEAEGHFEVFTPDLSDEQSHRIVMQRRSRLVGTLIRPEWLKPADVRVELVPAANPGGRRDDRIHDYKGRTFAYFDWVRPGTYDVTFRVRQFPDPFVRVDRLVIEPGQMGGHPRIRDLDLGAYLYRYEIFAVDENGQSIKPRRPLVARIQRPDGSRSHIGLPWRGGNRIEMFSASPQADVIPMAQGFAVDRTVVAAGRNEIVFRRIPPVEVTLAGLRAAAADVNVQVVLELLELGDLPAQLDAFDGGSKRIAGWYGRSKYTAAMLESGDTASLPVMRAGPHRVILRFGVGQGVRPQTVVLPPVEVQVTPGAGPQRVAVSYDAGVTGPAIVEARRLIAEKQRSGG